MGYQITAPELITLIRDRVADRDGTVWSDATILGRADGELEKLWTMVRLAGRDHDLDSIDVAPATLTALGNHGYSYEPPGRVAVVRQIEGLAGPDAIPTPILNVDLHNKDLGRYFAGMPPTWHRGQSGTVRFVGNVLRFTTLRIYFLRRWMPLHYGKASANGTTTTLALSSTPTGRLVKRNDVYIGHKVQFTSGANTDLVVTITAYDRVTNVVTFTPAVGATMALDDYSLLVPLDSDHSRILALETAVSLLSSGGNDDYLSVLMPLLSDARKEFQDSLATRDQDSPRTVWYTDR